MEILLTTKNKFFVLTIIFLFLIFEKANALPIGAILYKTSENGKMFGYNDFNFSMIPGQIYPGGVGIYIGVGKKSGKPQIVEVDYNGARTIPASFFVDLDKGEKFIGAKIPREFNPDDKKLVDAFLKNIFYQTELQETFDFTYQTQKGPSNGEWTAVGFVEKMFESAGRINLSYHLRPDSMYDNTYYSINITPDGFDEQTVINEQGDVFSQTKEFSKIHKIGSGDFWERFTYKEIKDLVHLIGEAGETLTQIIETNIFGLSHNQNRYFFFPYTQFVQPTLKDVKTDIVVASYGKANLPHTLSEEEIRKKTTLAFAERLTKEFAIETAKNFVIKYLGVGKISAVYNSVKSVIKDTELFEQGIKLATGKDINVIPEESLEKFIEQKISIKAAVGSIEESIQYADSKIRETAEISDRNFILSKKQQELEQRINKAMAEIDTEPDILETIENLGPKVENFGQVREEKNLAVEDKSKILENYLQKIEQKGQEKIEDIAQPEVVQPLEIIKEPIIVEKKQGFAKGEILVNEVFPNPLTGDEQEWIELYNNSDRSIDLSEWSIEDSTGKGKILNKLIISPYSYVVLYQGQDFSFYLNNSGDIIKLKYQETVIDQVTYGDFDDGNVDDNAPKPDKGQFLARERTNQNNWLITTTATPGLINRIVKPTSEKKSASALSSSGGG